MFGIPLDDGKMALLFLPNNSSSGPAFNTRLYKDGMWEGRTSNIGLTGDQLMQVVLSPLIKGKQVVLRVQVYNSDFPEYNQANEGMIAHIQGEKDRNFSGPQLLGIDGFEAPEDWALKLAGLR